MVKRGACICTLFAIKPLFCKALAYAKGMSYTVKNAGMNTVQPTTNASDNSRYNSFAIHSNITFDCCVSISGYINYKTNMRTRNVIGSVARHIIVSKIPLENIISSSAAHIIDFFTNTNRPSEKSGWPNHYGTPFRLVSPSLRWSGLIQLRQHRTSLRSS